MEIAKMNTNESKVLQSLRNEVISCTRNEFGYIEDASRAGFSKHEFAGYISALKKKGVFEYIDGEFNGQFALKPEYFEATK